MITIKLTPCVSTINKNCKLLWISVAQSESGHIMERSADPVCEAVYLLFFFHGNLMVDGSSSVNTNLHCRGNFSFSSFFFK